MQIQIYLIFLDDWWARFNPRRSVSAGHHCDDMKSCFLTTEMISNHQFKIIRFRIPRNRHAWASLHGIVVVGENTKLLGLHQ